MNIHMHTHTYACTHTHTHTSAHSLTDRKTQSVALTHWPTHTHEHAHTHTQQHTHSQTDRKTQSIALTYSHLDPLTHMNMHTHTHTACSDSFTSCHSKTEVAYQSYYLTLSECNDTGPTSSGTESIMSGIGQGSRQGIILYVAGHAWLGREWSPVSCTRGQRLTTTSR